MKTIDKYGKNNTVGQKAIIGLNGRLFSSHKFHPLVKLLIYHTIYNNPFYEKWDWSLSDMNAVTKFIQFPVYNLFRSRIKI